MIEMEADDSQERFIKKKCLPGLTVCALLTGIFMIGAGSAVIVEEKTHATISTSLPIQRAPVVLLVAGILSLIDGIVWAVLLCRWIKNANFCDLKKTVAVLTALLLTSALLALVAGGLGVDYSKTLKSKFKEDLKEKIGVYGKTGLYETLVNIDKLQKEDKCCGVINYADWRNTIYGGHRYDKVPDSCCMEQKHACGFEFELSKIKRQGCLKVAVDKMNADLLVIGIGGIVAAVIQIIVGVGFCSCYIRESSNQDEHRSRVQVSYRKTTSLQENEDDDATATHEGDGSGAQSSEKPTGEKSPESKVEVHRGKSKTAPEMESEKT